MRKLRFKPATAVAKQAKALLYRQKKRIRKLVPDGDIQHVGSTAIPGALTKGDVDCVVRVPAGVFKSARKKLSSLYELNQPENWTRSFASFKDKGNLSLDFGVQLVAIGSKYDFFTRHRDALLANPAFIAEYNRIKTAHEGKSMRRYRRAKSAFFKKILKT